MKYSAPLWLTMARFLRHLVQMELSIRFGRHTVAGYCTTDTDVRTRPVPVDNVNRSRLIRIRITELGICFSAPRTVILPDSTGKAHTSSNETSRPPKWHQIKLINP